MIAANQWKEIMDNAITAARQAGTITLADAARLRCSVSEPIDAVRMKQDTEFRLGGKRDV